MIDIRDLNHMVVLASAWIMTNISLLLAVVIMVLQIYILLLKIRKMKRESNADNLIKKIKSMTKGDK